MAPSSFLAALVARGSFFGRDSLCFRYVFVIKDPDCQKRYAYRKEKVSRSAADETLLSPY
jgi:hypothetical protein